MSKTQIITGVERRRKFSDEEKANIVAEAMDSTMSAVARKHGISNSLLHSWKKKFPPKSFALVEIKTPEPKDISSTIQPTPIEMAV
ncbi:MAG TPA: transposase, partial [Oligoflexus sp.]|uniref:transposase n=1 Tax=Oligoflexus sp. TaxID=1971216 RepID=UPI002D41984E